MPHLLSCPPFPLSASSPLRLSAASRALRLYRPRRPPPFSVARLFTIYGLQFTATRGMVRSRSRSGILRQKFYVYFTAQAESFFHHPAQCAPYGGCAKVQSGRGRRGYQRRLQYARALCFPFLNLPLPTHSGAATDQPKLCPRRPQTRAGRGYAFYTLTGRRKTHAY